MISSNLNEATLARFATEVAKYPADQKQSAVMACLAIVQQEQGFVSQDAEAQIAAYLGMPEIAVHEVDEEVLVLNDRRLVEAVQLDQVVAHARSQPKTNISYRRARIFFPRCIGCAHRHYFSARCQLGFGALFFRHFFSS